MSKKTNIGLKRGRANSFRRTIKVGNQTKTLLFEPGVPQPLTDAQVKSLSFEIDNGLLVDYDNPPKPIEEVPKFATDEELTKAFEELKGELAEAKTQLAELEEENTELKKQIEEFDELISDEDLEDDEEDSEEDTETNDDDTE